MEPLSIGISVYESGWTSKPWWLDWMQWSTWKNTVILTPYDFFFWDFIKDSVYVPPVPTRVEIQNVPNPFKIRAQNNYQTETHWNQNILAKLILYCSLYWLPKTKCLFHLFSNALTPPLQEPEQGTKLSTTLLTTYCIWI